MTFTYKEGSEEMAEDGEKMAKEMFGDSDSEEEEGTLDPGAFPKTMTNNSAAESKDGAVEGRESKLLEMLGESDSKAEEKGLAVSRGSVSSVPAPTTTSTSTHKLATIEEKGEENTERDAESKRKLQELFGESSSEDDGSGSEEDDGDRQKRGSKTTNLKHGTGVKRLKKRGGDSSLRKKMYVRKNIA